MGKGSGATTRSLPRLFIPVILNEVKDLEVKDLEVKHLSGSGSRRILHFVQDDNWEGTWGVTRVTTTTRG